MVSGRATPVAIRENILRDRLNGMDIKSIAVKYNVHTNTVSRIINHRNIVTQTERSIVQRPYAMTERERRLLVRLWKQKPFYSAAMIKSELGLTASIRSINAFARSQGFRAYIAPRKIKITDNVHSETLENSGVNKELR